MRASLGDHVFAVDLDGVLFNTEQAILDRLRHRWGIFLPPAQLTFNINGLTENPDANFDLIQQFHDPLFYKDIEPVDGALKALQILKEHGQVVAITSRPERTRLITLTSCHAHFAGIIQHISHVCGTKQLRSGEIVAKQKEPGLHNLSAEGPVTSTRIAKKWEVARHTYGATHAIDDNPKECQAYARKRICAYLVTKPYNAHVDVMESIYLNRCASILDMAQTYVEEWSMSL